MFEKSLPSIRCYSRYFGCKWTNNSVKLLTRVLWLSKTEVSYNTSVKRSLSFIPQIPNSAQNQNQFNAGLSPGNVTVPISFEQARGIAETILLYYECGDPGVFLDSLRKDKSLSVGKKYRLMMNKYTHTQFHVISLFGYGLNARIVDENDPRPFQKKLQEFSVALFHLIENLLKNNENSKVTELQNLSNELVLLMLQQAFEIDGLPSVSIDQLRLLSSRLSVNLQDPQFLSMAEEIYKEKLSKSSNDIATHTEGLSQIEDELLVPCFLAAIKEGEIPGLEKNDNGYVILQTLITQNVSDPVVAQNFSAGMIGLHSKVPFFELPK